MKPTDITREEMWARQNLSAADIDYSIWERDKLMLHQMSCLNQSCTFVVDVYKFRYAFASSNFVDLLGYDSHKIATLGGREIIWSLASTPMTNNNYKPCRFG